MSISPDYSVVKNSYTKERKGFAPLVFSKDLLLYFASRSRLVVVLVFAFIKLIFDAFAGIKSYLVRRMFWGRGSFYRTAFHLFVFTITLSIVLSGISSRLNIFAEGSGQLALNDNIIGRKDIIYQSGSAEALSVITETQADFDVYKYIVQKNDTLSSIAKLYSKNITTLVWANNLGNANATLKTGQVLRIPAIDGAYYSVKKNDTLEKIAKYTNSNAIDIWDLNSNIINYENPVLTEGMELFIPNGVIPTPPPVVIKKQPVSSGVSTGASKGVIVPSGTFVSPLLHCPGWSWSRGYSSTHGGVDMAKGGGCWENSIGNGYVTKAGWGGWGFTTIIDHGNGLVSIYGHGTGRYAVKQGDYVTAGQDIMYMGNSGYSFGIHLHLELHLNGQKVNPENYVKLR
jgi:murein DD-endopeptidase MepM/ murein hydrolase activator NlpD